MKVGISGMTTIDSLLFVDKIVGSSEEVRKVQDYVLSLGGKGMVTAIASHYLGCDTKLFTLVGPDSELSQLLPKGFCKEYVQECLDRTCRTWISISPEQLSTTLVHSGKVTKKSLAKVLGAIPYFIDELDLLYMSTDYKVVTEKVLHFAFQKTLRVVANINMATITDPDDRDGSLLYQLLNCASVVILNSHESTLLLSRLKKPNWHSLKSKTLEEVIITNGAEGGFFAKTPFVTWEKFSSPQPKSVRCTVGAGDTFNGAFLRLRYIDSLNLDQSCTQAAKVASQKVSIRSSHLTQSRPANEP